MQLAVGQLKRMQTRLNEKELTAEQMGASSWVSAKTDDLASRYIEEADRMQNQVAKLKNDVRALEGTVAERCAQNCTRAAFLLRTGWSFRLYSSTVSTPSATKAAPRTPTTQSHGIM